MKSKGRIEPTAKIVFFPSSREEIKENVVRWIKEEKKVRFAITGTGILSATGKGQLVFSTPEGEEPGWDMVMETWYQKRTPTQNNTLKGLESIIYQVDNGQAPARSEDLWFIHQGIIEKANLKVYNSFTDSYTIISVSSPLCDTIAMNRFIEIAIEELVSRNLPDDIVSAMVDRPMSELFKLWYESRMVQDDILTIKNWDAYRLMIPYCEFTFKMGTEYAPLQRMHIVSAGADKADYEEPWNWIHASAHIHKKQHDLGWDPVLQDYPHMIKKVKRARELASAAEQKRREI